MIVKHLLGLITLLTPFLLFSQTDKGIKWTQGLSWEQIKLKAKRENKYIFLDCYATWCAPCKQMDNHVYNDDSIGFQMNDKFISVRVQCDKTENDSENVKQWYQDAEAIKKQYPLKGYPSFLFFDSSGKLLYNKVGYHGVKEFAKIVQDVKDSSRSYVYSLIEDYKKGKKNYGTMLNLIEAAEEILSDKAFIQSIAEDYKSNYLNKVKDESVFTTEKLNFLSKYIYLLKSNDKTFKLIYESPRRKTDTLFAFITSKILAYVINREEIVEKLYKENKAITLNPNWSTIEGSIKSKYGKTYVDRLIPKAKLTFNLITKNWRGYVKQVEKAIKSTPPEANGQRFGKSIGSSFSYVDHWALNGVAWNVFLGSNDRKALEKALQWSDLSIKLCSDSSVLFQYYDTKANILYKISMLFNERDIQKSIQIEKLTLNFKMPPSVKNDYLTTIKKMENKERTWPE